MTAPPDPLLPVQQVAQLHRHDTTPRWLVQHLWAHQAVGFIGGPPKCCKSWFGLDLAVSVASGTACLGRFPVEHPGPALVYLAEDGLPHVRHRIAALCAHRGIDLTAIELYVITAAAVRLDLPADQQRLQQTLARFQPRLLVLDPLVRLHRLDENNAAEVSGLLGFLRTLQREYDAAIAVVHHMSKKSRAQLGQALRGSSDLFAWADSNAYLLRHARGLTLTVEPRSAPSTDPIPVALASEPDASHPHLRVLAEPAEAAPPLPLTDALLQALKHADQPVPRAALRRKLRVNNQRLGNALLELERHRLIQRTPHGWKLAASEPPVIHTTEESPSPSPQPGTQLRLL